jgi:hypothetical protein
MNPSPHDPLNEEERRWAERLVALPEREPSAALDARIRTMARAAVSARRPYSHVVGWGLGASAAAVLSVALLLPALQQGELRQTAPTFIEPVAAPASRVPVEATESTLPSSKADQPPLILEAAAERSNAPTPAIPATPMPQAFPAGSLVTPLAEPAPPPAPSAPAPIEQERKPGAAGAAQAGAAATDPAARAAPATATSPATQPPPAAVYREEAKQRAPTAFEAPAVEADPAAWLQRIERLLHQRDFEVARREWRRFRERYSDYPVDADLKQQLDTLP